MFGSDVWGSGAANARKIMEAERTLEDIIAERDAQKKVTEEGKVVPKETAVDDLITWVGVPGETFGGMSFASLLNPEKSTTGDLVAPGVVPGRPPSRAGFTVEEIETPKPASEDFEKLNAQIATLKNEIATDRFAVEVTMGESTTEDLSAEIAALRGTTGKTDPGARGIAEEEPAVENLKKLVAEISALRETAEKTEPGAKTQLTDEEISDSENSEVSSEELTFKSESDEGNEATQRLLDLVETGDLTIDDFVNAIKNGADLTYVDDYEATFLHKFYCDPLIFLLMLEVVDIDKQDSDGNTPLHCAADLEEVQLLIAAGADPFIENDDGFTAKQVWEGNPIPGSKGIVQFLKGAERVHEAYKRRPLETNEAATNGLIELVETGDWDARRLAGFVERGADLTVVLPQRKTLLHIASEDTLALLLSLRVIDVNAKDNRKRTPLYYVMNLEELRLLLAAGANVLAKDWLGLTLKDFLKKRSDLEEKESIMLLVEKAEEISLLCAQQQSSETDSKLE
jgi:hypothetical protein